MKAELIHKLPLFASLNKEEVAWVAEKLPERTLAEGEIMMMEGDPSGNLFILVEGQVDIIKAHGTQDERILGLEGPGSVIGELSLFQMERRHIATVRARTPLKLLMISQEDFETLLKLHPELGLELMRVTTQRLEKTENAIIVELREKNQHLTQAYEELKIAHEQLLEKEKLDKELGLARYIQRSILPHSPPEHPTFEIGALMKPARSVGGDFYDFISLDGDNLGIIVGDVSDKGVPAALFMALTYSLMKVETNRTDSPENVLQRVNRHLIRMNPSCMFVTAFLCNWDYKSLNLVYARAGHPPPIILDHHSRRVDFKIGYGQVLGISENLTLDANSITISPGSTVLFYSDGVSEAVDHNGRNFGDHSLLRFLQENHHLPAQDICNEIMEAVIEFTDNEQQDDVLLVAMKVARQLSI